MSNIYLHLFPAGVYTSRLSFHINLFIENTQLEHWLYLTRSSNAHPLLWNHIWHTIKFASHLSNKINYNIYYVKYFAVSLRLPIILRIRSAFNKYMLKVPYIQCSGTRRIYRTDSTFSDHTLSLINWCIKLSLKYKHSRDTVCSPQTPGLTL